jgi:hypothetical protein
MKGSKGEEHESDHGTRHVSRSRLDETTLIATFAYFKIFQVVLKIVKHCRESIPATVTGQLMGLDVNGVLEVTHSFPMPKNNQDSEDDGKLSHSLCDAAAAAHFKSTRQCYHYSWFRG